MESKNKLKKAWAKYPPHTLWHWVQQLAPGCLRFGRRHQNGRSGVLLAYIIGGIAAYIIMRALGKCRYITRPPALSRVMRRKTSARWRVYITGWTYCFEIPYCRHRRCDRFGIYMGVWFPTVPLDLGTERGC